MILRCKASAAGTDNSDAENHSEPSAPPQASAGQSAGQSVTLTPSTQDNKSIQEKGGSGQSWWPYSMLRRTL